MGLRALRDVPVDVEIRSEVGGDGPVDVEIRSEVGVVLLKPKARVVYS